MAYHSLFDTIVAEDPTFRVGFDRQKYRGTLDEVLSETEEVLCSGSINTNVLTLALHPPRIIRALVDYKIQHPSSLEVELLLRDAIQLGLNVYRGREAVKEIRELRRRITKTGNKEVLKIPLNQPSDSITWNATHPSRSKGTARDLVTRTNSEDVLFVALAHGGVAAGMDAYLRYCDEVGSKDSGFYVARFSTQKLGDLTPKLSPTEIAYLQKQAKGRQPVIFDEDRASGKTLDRAQQFFTGTIFPAERVIILTNLDARAELMSLGFGKKLMEIDKYDLSDRKKHLYINEIYNDKIIKNIQYGSIGKIIEHKDFCENYKYFSKKKIPMESFIRY
jgi:hypothetical protein